jgi:hypothetical protein
MRTPIKIRNLRLFGQRIPDTVFRQVAAELLDGPEPTANQLKNGQPSKAQTLAALCRTDADWRAKVKAAAAVIMGKEAQETLKTSGWVPAPVQTAQPSRFNPGQQAFLNRLPAADRALWEAVFDEEEKELAAARAGQTPKSTDNSVLQTKDLQNGNSPGSFIGSPKTPPQPTAPPEPPQAIPVQKSEEPPIVSAFQPTEIGPGGMVLNNPRNVSPLEVARFANRQWQLGIVGQPVFTGGADSGTYSESGGMKWDSQREVPLEDWRGQ